jgi:uncharacterized protein (DUF2141 family)
LCAAALLLSAVPAWGQGILKVTVAGIPAAATRVVAIADGAPVPSPVYAAQSLTPPASSTLLTLSLPAGTYRIRVLADGPARALLASAQMSIQVPNGNTTSAFLALAAVSVVVAPSTPSTATAGAPVAIAFNITDWGDVMASGAAQLFTAASAFSVAAGGTLAASASPVRIANGSYTATLTAIPQTGSSVLYYALRVSIPTGSADSSCLFSPDPATRPQQPWQMSVVAQSGASVTVSQIPPGASRIVLIADVPPGAPVYAQQSVTPGTPSAVAFIALAANTYRLRVLADVPGSSMLASGQTTVAVSSGMTASAAVALTVMTVTVDPSTPATAAAASAVGIRLNIADAGDVLSGAYAYLWAGLSPFPVATGGTVVGVTLFSVVGQGTRQAAFTVNLPAGAATLYYVLRAQIPVGAGSSQLCSPDPAQAPGSPWQIQTLVTTGISLSVSGIPSGAARLVVLADGPLPAVWTEQAVPSGASSSTIFVALPAGTYRLRVLTDGASGNVLATGQTSAVAPAAGTGTASAALSVPVVTLSPSTPLSALAGAAVTLGFNIVDAGDLLESAPAYLYTGSAPFNLVAGGFCLGVATVVKSSPGHYTVSFAETVPSAAGAFYFEVRAQVATGLTPAFLDSPAPTPGALPWSIAVTLPGTQPCTPAAALRDTANAIRLMFYGSTTLQNLGGQAASDPAAAQSAGCITYVAVRDAYNAIWLAAFDPSTHAASWVLMGGTILGTPAVAVARNGVVYVAGRDTYGYYWLRAYTPGSGLGPWLFVGGNLASDPVMAASPDGSLYIVGRDTYNSVWSNWYIPTSGLQGWKWEPGTMQGKPAVTVGTDAYAYIAVRDSWNALWIGRLQGSSWMGWSYGGGGLNADPRVAATGDGTVYAVVLDSWNAVWYRGLTEGPSGPWLAWTNTGATLQALSPAALPGQLYIAGRDANNDLWWYRSTASQWTSIGNRGVTTGPLSAVPR